MPFCTLATRLVREQETIVVTFIVAPHVLDKTRTEVSRQLLDEPLGNSKVLQRIRYMLQKMYTSALYLSASNLKDPLAIQLLEWQ